MHTAVGTEILQASGGGPAWLGERNALTRSDRHPVIGIVPWPIARYAWLKEASDIGPARIRAWQRSRRRGVGEQRDGIGNDGSCRVCGGGSGSGGPKRIGDAGVVISPHIDWFFRGNSEAVTAGRRSYRLWQVTDCFRTHATIHETQSVTWTIAHVVLRFSHGGGRARVSGSCGIGLNHVARGQGVRITAHLVRAHGRGLGRNGGIRPARVSSDEIESSA